MSTRQFLACIALATVCLFNSCEKQQAEESEKETSIIGTWIAVNLDVLDEFATGITERIACSDIKVVFTKEGKATFYYSGNSYGFYPRTFSSAYSLQDKGDGKYFVDFTDGLYDEDGIPFKVSDVFMPAEGGSLTIRFGHKYWDWYDQWYFAKASD